MALEHRIDPETGIIRFVTAGSPTLEEQREHWLVAVSDPKATRPLRVLDDRRGVEAFGAASDISRISGEMNDWVDVFRDARIAFLVGHSAPFGMVRMFEARTDELPFECRAFYELDAAEGWLGRN